MWCSSCRADVAAELSTDNRRMLCARCQSELGIAATATPTVVSAPRTVETERDARELLARWSTQNLLDSSQSTPVGSGSRPGKNSSTSGDTLQVRIDPPGILPQAPSGPFGASIREVPKSASVDPLKASRNHPADEVSPPDHRMSAPGRHSPDPMLQQDSTTNSRSDRPAVSREPEHDQDRVVREALQKQLNRRLSWSNMAGQLFAYGGVALLTCGTVLVMWSYFGGPPTYLPTGLLTAAVGQMLLFLGVVTLISSGMEQTVHEVSWRIDHLADEIYEMGLCLEDLERSHQSGPRQASTANPSQPDGGLDRKAA